MESRICLFMNSPTELPRIVLSSEQVLNFIIDKKGWPSHKSSGVACFSVLKSEQRQLERLRKQSPIIYFDGVPLGLLPYTIGNENPTTCV
jgi:hypothetical protein